MVVFVPFEEPHEPFTIGRHEVLMFAYPELQPQLQFEGDDQEEPPQVTVTFQRTYDEFEGFPDCVHATNLVFEVQVAQPSSL